MFMFKERTPGFVNTTRVLSQNATNAQYQELPNCYLNQWYPGQVSQIIV